MKKKARRWSQAERDTQMQQRKEEEEGKHHQPRRGHSQGDDASDGGDGDGRARTLHGLDHAFLQACLGIRFVK